MNLDHIAIERRLDGDTSVTLNDDETYAAAVILLERGETAAQTMRTLGGHERIVKRARAEIRAAA